MSGIALAIMFWACLFCGAYIAVHGGDVPLWLSFAGIILFFAVIFD